MFVLKVFFLEILWGNGTFTANTTKVQEKAVVLQNQTVLNHFEYGDGAGFK